MKHKTIGAEMFVLFHNDITVCILITDLYYVNMNRNLEG